MLPRFAHDRLVRLFVAVCCLLCTTGMAIAKEPKSLLADGAAVKKLAGGMRFTEGPVWLPTQAKLVFSDIPNSKLMQWSEAEGLKVFRASEQANGNILDLKGRIISCQHRARNLIRIEADGKTTVLAEKFKGKRFNSPNDVAVRSDGSLWFTDPPWGLWGANQKPEIDGHWVFKLNPATKKIEAIVKDLAMPNGIVFSPDESRVYIADTGGHRRHPNPKFQKSPPGVHCYRVSNDGTLGEKLFQTKSGSDGMAVDVKGNIYTTTGGQVRIFDADGKPIQQVDVPEGPANVCFGGADGRTLFITARTSLYSVRTRYPGAKSNQ